MKIDPIKDRVLVRPAAPEEVSAGGIVLTGSATKADGALAGDVLAAGPMVTDLVVGDAVVYSPYAGSDVTVDGEEFVILREPDVFAVKT